MAVGLLESRVLILCLSAHIFGTEWSQVEQATLLFRDPLSLERCFLPLCLDDTSLPAVLTQFLPIDWRVNERGIRALHSTLRNLIEPLSDREIEVLHLVAAGLSNAEIADRLIISMSTVKTHINRIFAKLAVQSRTQALVRARELGLLTD